MHHFKAVSSSGSSIYRPPSPVVSHPIISLSSLPSLSNTTSTSRSAVTVAGTLPRCANTLSAISSSSSSSSSNGGYGAGVGGAVFSHGSSGATPMKLVPDRPLFSPQASFSNGSPPVNTSSSKANYKTQRRNKTRHTTSTQLQAHNATQHTHHNK